MKRRDFVKKSKTGSLSGPAIINGLYLNQLFESSIRDVTVARTNPTGTGLLVLKGTLVGTKGWGENEVGCYDIADIVGKENGTAEEFVRKQADYGNHLPWVYGDYSEELQKLGTLIGVDVLVVS